MKAPTKYKLFLILLLLFSFSYELMGQEGVSVKLKCIVLDPGHGGKDYGCISRDKKYNEKTIVLSVAKKLGNMIEKNHPDVKVVYTRKTDVFIPLAQRAEIANKNKADLFLSIHVNSTAGTSAAHGTETFTMGNHVSSSNFELSKRENSVILMEDDYTTKYEGFNPDSPESYIIFSLLQNAYSEQSIKFAQLIQEQFHLGPIKYNRGVKQAGFLVLKNTTMPSVLTELGFISNPDDLKTLTSENGQDKMARRLYDAFLLYKQDLEDNGSKEEMKEDDKEEMKEDVQEEVKEEIKEDVKAEVKSEIKENVKENVKENIKENVKEEIKEVAEVTYHIQILSVGKQLKRNAPDLKGESGAQFVQEGRLYKYYLGKYSTREAAVKDLERVRRKFKGAFVISIRDGQIVK